MRRKQKRLLTFGLIVLAAVTVFLGFYLICRSLAAESKKIDFSMDNTEYNPLTGKTVLFVTAREMEDPVFDAQKEGVQEILSEKGIAVDEFVIDTFVEDGDKDGADLLVNVFKFRMEDGPKYDAIITGDDLSLDFVIGNRSELFDGIPVVFMGTTQIRHAQKSAENPLMTGSIEIRPIKETLDVAVMQNPSARYVTAIVDGSPLAYGDKEQFYSFALSYPKYIFTTLDVNTMTFDALQKKISDAGDSTIFLYLSGLVDSNGMQCSLPEMESLVSKSACVPVYTDFYGAVGDGFLGGLVTDPSESGRQTAALVSEILSGTDADSIPLSVNDKGRYLFDFSVAKKFSIDQSTFPDKAEWLNDMNGFWKENSQVLIALFLILFGGILMTVVLAIIALRSRIIQKELKTSRKQLEFMVSHDFLTGLPKIQTAHQIISEMVCSGSRFSVVKINITNFKGINNAYTHGCGDAVLAKISSLLMKLDSNEYFVARDGSEFIIIYRKGYLSEVSKHFEHLRVTFLNIPFAYNGVRFDINTKMGIFNVPVESTLSDDEILSAVNYALYVAKAGGKYKYVFFTDEMREKIRNTQEVVKILEEACENDGFEAFFQPQIDIDSGQIFGYESLCRLKNHTISPALFIPVAENNGLITRIGRIMTEKVVQQMASMRDDGIPLHRFAINYSAGQIVDTGYVNYLRSLLEKYDISPHMIEIEITESLYLGKDQDSASLFAQLEDLGVNLALDDFGTGYSSISYLTYVPVGVVKIDKTMVDIYLHDGKDVLIENIINMVHSLGMKLIAEGIEEEWQYEKLKKFDCDVIQGYYFSKPMRGSDVKKFSV